MPSRQVRNMTSTLQPQSRSLEGVNLPGGFANGRSSNSARKRYIRTVLYVEMMEAREKSACMLAITLTNKDTERVVPHQDDHVVVSLTRVGYQVGRVLVDGGSSTNMIFWTCFEAL